MFARSSNTVFMGWNTMTQDIIKFDIEEAWKSEARIRAELETLDRAMKL